MSLYASNADKAAKAIQEQEGLTPFLRLYLLSELGDMSRTLGVYIYHAEREDGTCWASDETIAELAGVSVRTVQTHTFTLLTKQHLTSLGNANHGLPEYAVSERFRKKSKELWFPLPFLALKQELSRAALRVYSVLLFKATPADGMLADIGADKLAKDTGLSVRAVKYSLTELQTRMLLLRVSNSNTSIGKVFPPSSYSPEGQGAIVAPMHGATVEDLHRAIAQRLPCNGAPSYRILVPPQHAEIADKLEGTRTPEKEHQSELGAVVPLDLREKGSSKANSQEETPSATGNSPPAPNGESASVDFGKLCEALLEHKSARDLIQFSDKSLALLASIAQAAIRKAPASAEFSLCRMFELVEDCEERNKTDDPIRNLFGHVRDKLQRAELRAIESWLFDSSCGLEFFVGRIQNIREVLEPLAQAEQSKLDASLCEECGINPAQYKNPLNQGICYDNWTSRPEFCVSRKFSDDIWREAKNLAREQLLNADDPTVHPTIWAQVVIEAAEVIAEGKWLLWNAQEQQDSRVDLAEVTADPEALKSRVEALRKLFAESQSEGLPDC